MKHFTSMKTIRNLTCAVALSTAGEVTDGFH